MISVITGLKSEIAALEPAWRGPGFAFFAAGGSAERAEAAARDMARRGAKLLMSVGLAGGLDPALKCGDLILGTAVITPSRRAHLCDAAWSGRLMAALRAELRTVEAAVAGSQGAVASVRDKIELVRETGAVCVDMESHGVARAAAEMSIPLVALRVIADPAERAVPLLAVAGMAADGSTRAAPVLARLLLRPWELPRLLAVARDSRHAHAALGRVALAAAGVLVG